MLKHLCKINHLTNVGWFYYAKKFTESLDFFARAVLYLLQGQKVGDCMSPRTGRPPKENPRNINLNIRVTKDEAQMIQACADILNTTRTEVIVKGVKMVQDELGKK